MRRETMKQAVGGRGRAVHVKTDSVGPILSVQEKPSE